MKDQEYEPKFLGEKMTDFEKNLFLKRQVKELKEAVKKLMRGEEIRNRDFKIGQMQSEIDELRHNLREAIKPSYQSMTKSQKKNLRYKAKDVVSQNIKEQLKILQDVIIKRNKRIEELEEELKISKL